MTSTKITVVTGTPDANRRDMSQDTYSPVSLPVQRRVSEAPPQVDGQCTCCPYGYHIDLDFLNFCQDLEAGSTLQSLWRIQRTKRNLRKSMELMLSAEEVVLQERSSTLVDVGSSSEAERLMHMIDYEQSASHKILRQIDSSMGAVTASIESGGVWRRASSDSDDVAAATNTTSYVAVTTEDHTCLKNVLGSGLHHADSMTSLSSASTTFNEPPLVLPTELVDTELHLSVNSTTNTSQVVENPVLEMATAEMKHHSTTTSAELADGDVNHLHTSLEFPVLEMATAEVKYLHTNLEHPVLEMATAEVKHYSTTSSAEVNHLHTSLEHPVLEMATAEVKHYSTTSSAELADTGRNQSDVSLESPVLDLAPAEMRDYTTSSSAQLASNGTDQPDTKPETVHPQPSARTRTGAAAKILRLSLDDKEASAKRMKEAMATSLQRIKVLEEQVRTIPILQVRISVLKEEKRLLNLQLKASKSSTRPQTSSVGVGDDSVSATDEEKPSFLSSIIFQPSTAKDDALLQSRRSLVEKSLLLPQPATTSSVGVGDHSVMEPYNVQPDLPTGYTVRENETNFEIHSRKFLEDEKITTYRQQMQHLNTSSVHTSSHDTRDQSASIAPRAAPRSSILQATSGSSQPKFSVSEIHKSLPKTLTRSIGTGDGNVFEGSKLQVHEKELRTVILGPSSASARRNVGIECRPATRDVGVSFVCEQEKPETRTVGVNVSYDTSHVMTSLDFKGEAELRMALQGVLHRNVRSVGTTCIMKPTTCETGTTTDVDVGVSVACGDEEHRVDVEIRPSAVRKSVAVVAKPDVGHRCISTNADWMLDASTSTIQTSCYHKAVMTDKLQHVFVSTNTEPVSTRPASNQTEQNVFISIDQIRHVGSNTEQIRRSCTGISTDTIATRNVYVNTEERISNLFHESSTQANVSSHGLQSLQKTTEKGGKSNDVQFLSESKDIQAAALSRTSDVTIQAAAPSRTSDVTIQAAAPSRTSDVTLQEQVIDKNSSHEAAFHGRTEYSKKSSRFDSGDTHYSSLEISTPSSPFSQSHSSSQTSRISTQEHSDEGNAALEDVSTASSDDKFSETVVEHYVITKDGKKLVSEEKITTSSLGTNRSFREYTDEIHQVAEPEISSTQRSYSECSNTEEGGSAGFESTTSSSSYSITTGHESMATDNSCIHEINNKHKTEDDMAEGSSASPSDAVDGGSGIYQVSQEISQEHTESRQSTTSQKVTVRQVLSDKQRPGSVEDFMPGDVRKYMSLDHSTSKNSDDLVHRFSGESSYASNLLAAATTSGAAEIKHFNMAQTVTTRTGDDTFVQKTEEGSGIHILTSESGDGEKEMKDSTSTTSNEPPAEQGQNVTDSSAISATTCSSSLLQSQDHPCSGHTSDVVVEATFTDRSFSSSGTESFREVLTTTDGVHEEVVSTTTTTGVGCMVTSMDRELVPLKSIMKHTRTETQIGSNKKAIKFAETVTGGTCSSSEEENSSSDTESPDETVTQDLPGHQVFDQSIREIYELSEEVKSACRVLATYLTDSTSIQTKELNASQDTLKQEWFQLSSHKLSNVHQVEDFLSSANSESKRLLEYIVNLADENGNTAIHYSISHCNFEIAGLLLESEVCDVNKRNKAGYTPIMLAGLASVLNLQQQDVIRRLLSRGYINARASSTEQTALMLAASHGRTEMAKLLVEEGADINLQDEDGSTALMCACEHGHLEIVNFLLTQPSIDVNITDNEKSTALHIAMEAGHKDIGVVLYKHLNFSKVPSPGSPKKRKSSSSPTQSNFGIR